MLNMDMLGREVRAPLHLQEDREIFYAAPVPAKVEYMAIAYQEIASASKERHCHHVVASMLEVCINRQVPELDIIDRHGIAQDILKDPVIAAGTVQPEMVESVLRSGFWPMYWTLLPAGNRPLVMKVPAGSI